MNSPLHLRKGLRRYPAHAWRLRDVYAIIGLRLFQNYRTQRTQELLVDRGNLGGIRLFEARPRRGARPQAPRGHLA